jgi:hypothetical protein
MADDYRLPIEKYLEDCAEGREEFTEDRAAKASFMPNSAWRFPHEPPVCGNYISISTETLTRLVMAAVRARQGK